MLLNQETIFLTELPTQPRSETRKSKPSSVSDPLFEPLRSLRRRLAEEEGKPSFLIFSDATLHDMIRVRPKTLEQMLTVSGIGQHKLAQYGQFFLEVLQQHSLEVEAP